ncbi:MAG: peptidylprolyl isomerase, partial [Acidobacteriota bacterium]
RGDGWGGPGWTLRDELSTVPFEPGVVGLALAGPDTAGSQLFVTLTRQPHLDGRYPVLGRLTSGLDVAARLRRGDRILRARVGAGEPPQRWPVWYGELSPARLDADMPGWREEGKRYQPEGPALERLATAGLRYGIDVAMGTWCSDSHEQIPRLQRILTELGERSPFISLRLHGVDRSKELTWAHGPVELVPTIVVTFEGGEVGRIVETPSSGSLERDLVRILAPLEGWPIP